MKFEIPDCNALSTLDRITWFETGSSKILFAYYSLLLESALERG